MPLASGRLALLVSGVLAATVCAAAAPSMPGIFRRREVRVPADSVQYLFLPLPGGKDLDSVRDFGYTLDLPVGVELDVEPRLICGSSFATPVLAYPEPARRAAQEDGHTRYELCLPGVGSTGVQVFLSFATSSCGYVSCLSLTGTSGEWHEFDTEFAIPAHLEMPEASARLWVLRWVNHPENRDFRLARQARGVVEVDDLVIRSKRDGAVVYRESFDQGAPSTFLPIRTPGVAIIEAENARFARITTDDAVAEVQQSLVTTPIQFVHGEEYRMSCRARVSASATPDGLCVLPVWLKIGRLAGGVASITCSYSYAVGDQVFRSSAERLQVTVDEADVTPESIETVFWSAAENPMSFQCAPLRDRLVRLTRQCGVKVHLSAVSLNPWLPPLRGDLSGVDLRDPLCDTVKHHGMKVMPYIHNDRIPEDGLAAYSAAHPTESMDEYVNLFGQTAKASRYSRCLTRTTDPAKDYWRDVCGLFEQAARVNRWDGLMWDFEQPVILGLPGPDAASGTCCFCRACVDAFKRFAGLDDIDRPPDRPMMLAEGYPLDRLAGPARAILANYPLEWLRFRAAQNAGMYSSLLAAVQKSNPAARFFLYSGTYQDQRPLKGPWHHCEFYGVHLPTAGTVADAYIVHNYPMVHRGNHSGLLEMRLSRQALRRHGREVQVLTTVGPTHLSPAGAYGLGKNETIQAVAEVEADGFHIYRFPAFDSLAWLDIRAGLSAVRHFESFFRKGVRLDLLCAIDNPRLRHCAWLYGEDLVLFVFNDTAADETVTLRTDVGVNVPAQRFTAADYFTGEVYPDPGRITIAVPARDTAVVSYVAR